MPLCPGRARRDFTGQVAERGMLIRLQQPCSSSTGCVTLAHGASPPTPRPPAAPGRLCLSFIALRPQHDPGRGCRRRRTSPRPPRRVRAAARGIALQNAGTWAPDPLLVSRAARVNRLWPFSPCPGPRGNDRAPLPRGGDPRQGPAPPIASGTRESVGRGRAWREVRPAWSGMPSAVAARPPWRAREDPGGSEASCRFTRRWEEGPGHLRPVRHGGRPVLHGVPRDAGGEPGAHVRVSERDEPGREPGGGGAQGGRQGAGEGGCLAAPLPLAAPPLPRAPPPSLLGCSVVVHLRLARTAGSPAPLRAAVPRGPEPPARGIRAARAHRRSLPRAPSVPLLGVIGNRCPLSRSPRR